MAWWIITSSGLVLASTSIIGIANFAYPDYSIERWHVYLTYLLVLIVTVSPLIVSRMVPWVTQCCLFLSLLGVTVTFVVVLAMHQHFNNASYLLQPASTVGSSGWPHGFAWILGAANSMYAYVGLDGAMHIAEEIRDPGKQVPRIMNLT